MILDKWVYTPTQFVFKKFKYCMVLHVGGQLYFGFFSSLKNPNNNNKFCIELILGRKSNYKNVYRILLGK